jgi:hypothetical protein
VIFAPVSTLTLNASDLGRITNGRDCNPDEKRPFLFSFSKPKVLVAWRKTGAMLLTRACLMHSNARSVAGDQGPDEGELETPAATHKKSKVFLAEAGFNSTFAGSVPTHTHLARPSTDGKKIAGLVRLGNINSKNLWAVSGATAFYSEVAVKAQAEILTKADTEAAASADAAALEFARAEVAAAAAKERRGDKGDSTMSGVDLAAAMKFAHLKKSMKEWGSCITR